MGCFGSLSFSQALQINSVYHSFSWREGRSTRSCRWTWCFHRRRQHLLLDVVEGKIIIRCWGMDQKASVANSAEIALTNWSLEESTRIVIEQALFGCITVTMEHGANWSGEWSAFDVETKWARGSSTCLCKSRSINCVVAGFLKTFEEWGLEGDRASDAYGRTACRANPTTIYEEHKDKSGKSRINQRYIHHIHHIENLYCVFTQTRSKKRHG